MESDGVESFFSGKSVFVTGATGFLGKVVIEKLLRSCPDLESVYILIRSKGKHLDAHKRLQDLLENSIFDTLRKTNSGILKKIHAISGDVCLPRLGLSDQDEKLLTANLSIVIHSAATVKFDETLQSAITTNVKGLKELLELSKSMKFLKAFVCVSTAYSNCDQPVIEERVYPAPAGALAILNGLSECGNFNDFLWAGKGHPNTYTYSKAVAEQLLLLSNVDLPVCIVRPSMVTAAWKEPVPGWIDSVYGPTALTIGAGLGILRAVQCDLNKIVNIMPVDIVANVILCAAWETATKSNAKSNKSIHQAIPVYNCCEPGKNALRYKDFLKYLHENVRKEAPFSNAIMYPRLTVSIYKISYAMKNAVLQFVPALFFEAVTRNGRSMRSYRKAKDVVRACQYFMLNDWKFSAHNVSSLFLRLSSADKMTFCLSTDSVNWEDYFKSYCLGIRRHIFKQEDATIPEARLRMLRLHRVYLIPKFAGVILCGIVFLVAGWYLFA